MSDNNTDIPAGFKAALGSNLKAMKYFSTLSQNERAAVINETRSISSKQEMQQFVSALGNQIR